MSSEMKIAPRQFTAPSLVPEPSRNSVLRNEPKLGPFNRTLRCMILMIMWRPFALLSLILSSANAVDFPSLSIR